jgi:hypothetical protein
MPFLTRPVVAAIVVLALPAAGLAQTTDRTAAFGNLERALRPGQTVVVENADGQRVKGEVVAASPTNLTIEVSRTFEPVARLTYAESDVRSVVHRDSLLNGALIGLGAGAASAWSFVRWQCGPAGFDKECSAIATAVGVAFVPIGAGLGALVDFLARRTVYRRPGYPTVAFAPIATGGHRGVRVTVRF